MKFDPAKDMEFFTGYAHTLLDNNLPAEISFVLICGVPNHPIRVKSNSDPSIAKNLLELGWNSVSDYLTAHPGDQPTTTEQKQ